MSSLLNSIYTGETGLLAFSNGLDVISNNVANLNTPGFKGKNLLFRDLFYHLQVPSGVQGNKVVGAYIGEGVNANQTSIRFNQGQFQATGNSNDAAIDGNGFFVVRKNGQTFYTRVGQFEVGSNDKLVTRDDQSQVMALGPSGKLVDFSVAGLRTSPPQATTQVSFVNNLSSDSPSFDANNLQVFDSLGNSQTLQVFFQNNSAVLPGSWIVDVLDQQGQTIAAGQEIRFQSNGAPLAGFNQFSVNLGQPYSSFELFFGAPGTFTGATSFAAGSTSTLAVGSQNGRAGGSLTTTEFNPEGYLLLNYSNGQTAQGPRLALGWFEDLQLLNELPMARFQTSPGQQPIIAGAGGDVMGKIVGANIELSNVQSTSEFTDLIIDQRGYQASSQIISVANEMLQELLTMTRTSR